MTFRRVTGVRWVLAALLAGGALAPTSAGRATTPPDTAPGLADAAATTGSDESTAPPPSGSAPNTTTTLAPLVYADGLFTSPDGTFTAAFDAAPSRVLDTENGLASYLLGVDEDTQSIVMFSGGAFGAGQRASPTERADRFLEASGIDIERLANSPTRLGPFPAGHFVAKLTLGDERRAAVYGLVVDRLATIGDVLYAFYTDVGLDDNGAARAFVGSFELRFDVLPAPPPTTTTPTTLPLPVATTPRATGGAPSSVAPADVDTATIPAVTTATAAATTSTEAPMPAVPDGATESYDGRWWVTFPEGVTPELRAGSADGFGYAEYLAEYGGDALCVLVTEVPIGSQWVGENVIADTAERWNGEVHESANIDVGGFDAVRITVAPDGDGPVEVLVVNAVDQVYTVSFVDGGAPSPDVGADFLASFTIAR